MRIRRSQKWAENPSRPLKFVTPKMAALGERDSRTTNRIDVAVALSGDLRVRVQHSSQLDAVMNRDAVNNDRSNRSRTRRPRNSLFASDSSETVGRSGIDGNTNVHGRESRLIDPARIPVHSVLYSRSFAVNKTPYDLQCRDTLQRHASAMARDHLSVSASICRFPKPIKTAPTAREDAKRNEDKLAVHAFGKIGNGRVRRSVRRLVAY